MNHRKYLDETHLDHNIKIPLYYQTPVYWKNKFMHTTFNMDCSNLYLHLQKVSSDKLQVNIYVNSNTLKLVSEIQQRCSNLWNLIFLVCFTSETRLPFLLLFCFWIFVLFLWIVYARSNSRHQRFHIYRSQIKCVNKITSTKNR